MKREVILIAVIVSIIGTILFCAIKNRMDCADAGGVMVRGFWEMECVVVARRIQL